MGTTVKRDYCEFDKQVVNDLLDGGSIDSNVLVRVVQLMSLPEFDDFFSALCEVGLADTSSAAEALHRCAVALVRPKPDGLEQSAA